LFFALNSLTSQDTNFIDTHLKGWMSFKIDVRLMTGRYALPQTVCQVTFYLGYVNARPEVFPDMHLIRLMPSG
jgi:hypothetical protein